MRDRADSTLQVARTDSGFRVTVDKVKAAAKPAPFAIRFQADDSRAVLEYGGESGPGVSKSESAVVRIQGLVEGLGKSDGLTSKAIQGELAPEIGQKTVNEALTKLRGSGAIGWSGSRYAGVYRYWDPACGDSTVTDEAVASAIDDAPAAASLPEQDGGQP